MTHIGTKKKKIHNPKRFPVVIPVEIPGVNAPVRVSVGQPISVPTPVQVPLEPKKVGE